MPRQDPVFKEGHCLGDVFGLTCELVAGQPELLQRAQLSNALRERACECMSVCMSSVFDFDCCEYHIRMQSPERTLTGHCQFREI